MTVCGVATASAAVPGFRRRFFKVLLIVIVLLAGPVVYLLTLLLRNIQRVESLRPHARIEQRRTYLFPFPQIFSPANQERLLPRIYSIEGIHFHPQTTDPMPHLRSLSLDSLKSIGFQKAKLGPEDMVCLQKFPRLTSIMFQQCTISEGTLRALRNLPKLRELVVERGRIAPHDSVVLSQLPSLIQVHFDTKCHDELIQGLCQKPQLKAISVRLPPDSTESQKRLRSLPGLSHLFMDQVFPDIRPRPQVGRPQEKPLIEDSDKIPPQRFPKPHNPDQPGL